MTTAINIKKLLDSTQYRDACAQLYHSDGEAEKVRFQSLSEQFDKLFPNNASERKFISSPGRIELLGNHTDHNGGKVLCSAITVDALALVSKSDSGYVSVSSDGYPMFSTKLSSLERTAADNGTSFGLVRGVCAYFASNGKKVGGLDIVMTSDVPKGAGVSSSSSFEVLICEALNYFYNESSLDSVFKAKAAQYAENVYFGKPCGLMDQMAIAQGGVNKIDFRDAANPEITSVDFPFDDIDIFVTNTGGDHSDLTDDYAGILGDMKSIAQKFNCAQLRDVSEADFQKQLVRLKNETSGRSLLRAMHFYEENRRVDEAYNALMHSDLDKFIAAVRASGRSSEQKLQNLYSPKDTRQCIPFGLAISDGIDGVLATRVHGGGFAGTILSFVLKSASERYFELMSAYFGSLAVLKIGVRKSGATVISL